MGEVSDAQIESEIKEIFDYFDSDKSGSIDANELKECLKCLGENVVDEEVADMISAMDIDCDGTIDYHEFLKEMRKRYGKRDVEKELQAVFNRFVVDGSTSITKEGVQNVMNTIFKENLTLEDAEDMIKIVGGTKGYVTYDEFKIVMLEGVNKARAT